MSRRLLPVIALLGLLSLPNVFGADEPSYVIVDSVRIPAESYVGDEVELRYTIRTAATLDPAQEVTDPAWGDITSVRIVPRGDEYDVRVLLVPYEPGTLTLPRIDLGPIGLDGLSIVVSSVLDGNAELRSIYGPRRLPGTRVAMFLIVLGVVIPAALLFYLLGPGRVLVRTLLERHRARVPYRNLTKTLDRLESTMRSARSREFYTSLIASLQDVMTSRLGFDCRAATSSELASYLPAFAARCGASATVAAPLAELFAAADEAKFAHVEVRRKTRTRHLEICREAVTALETMRRKPRPARPKTLERAAQASRGDHVGI